MSNQQSSSGRPKRGKQTTLSHQLDDIAHGLSRVPSRRAGAGSRLNAILDAVKHNGSVPDLTELPRGQKKSVSLPSTPKKKFAAGNIKKRKRDASEKKATIKSDEKSDKQVAKSKEDTQMAAAPPEPSKEEQSDIKSASNPSKKRKIASGPKKRRTRAEKDSDFSNQSSSDSDDYSEEQDPDPGKMFADHDIYDDEDDDSLVEPRSADATLGSKLPTPFPLNTVSQVPVPKIVTSSPPPSPTKAMRSPSKSATPADSAQQRQHRETAVSIHDRPTPSKLSLSAVLHDVQERAVQIGSPIKTATSAPSVSQAMPPPATSLSPPVARRSLLSAMEDSMQSSDGMVTLEIESSQDGNSRSSSPAPSQFLRTSNQLLSDNAMSPQ